MASAAAIPKEMLPDFPDAGHIAARREFVTLGCTSMETKEFTPTELIFLRHYGYRPENVFDGRYYSQAGWKRMAKEAGMDLVLGNGCRNGGHRLKTRAGHCAQCDPKKLAFLARHTAEQYVYIAGSRSKQLLKIGTCRDLFQRENQLCAERYGGAHDWGVIYAARVKNAGDVEYRAQASLRRYWVARSYMKNNEEQTAVELLRCRYSRVLTALTALIGDAGDTIRPGDDFEFDWDKD